MVNKEQKLMVDTQKMKRRELKHTTTENHHSQRKPAREEEKTRKQQNSQKTINKTALVTPFLSIITPNEID